MIRKGKERINSTTSFCLMSIFSLVFFFFFFFFLFNVYLSLIFFFFILFNVIIFPYGVG